MPHGRGPVAVVTSLAGLVAVIGAPASQSSASTGAGSAPSYDLGSGTSDATLPPQPSKEDLEAVVGLASLDSLRSSLLETYPDEFGGLFNNEDDSFTVLVTENSNSVRDFSADFQRTMAPESRTELRYSAASHTLRELYDLRDAILDRLGEWTDDGAWTVGIDESHNATVVLVDRPVAGLKDELSKEFDTDAIDVRVVGQPKDVGRYDDVAPWNAGNQLVNSQTGGGCTSGFGVHNSAGTFGTTAGHCGIANLSYAFYNTRYTNPSYTLSRLVGQTMFNDWYGPSPRVDVQSISGSTSKLFWKGGGDSATRQWVAGVANPSSNNAVCVEGSFGFERCGTVTVTDFPSTDGAIGVFLVSGAACIGGDSGAPMIWPTGYGYIAQGIAKATNGPDCFGSRINEVMYTLGATVNSLTTGP